jgi:hypothetical protein
MKAEFLNPDGYEIHPRYNTGLFRKTVFEFDLDIHKPLTFQRANGELIRPDRHYLTDKGSVPVCLRWLVPHDTYERSFLLHDSAFLHHGHYVKSPLGGDFVFRTLTMDQANSLLAEMMDAEGAWGITRAAVYKAVKWFGAFSWGDGKRRKEAGTQRNMSEPEAIGI